MCGRYFITNSEEYEEYHEILNEIQKKVDESKAQVPFKAEGEIFPTDIVPVITNNSNLAPTPFLMKWGYTPVWDEKKLLINARSETAGTKVTFKADMAKHRCIIPASHYFEWQKTPEGKIKHTIWPTGKTMLYMAGLYRVEGNHPVFTILTRDPASNISFIHNRMPVILHKDIHKDWLNLDNKAEEVLKDAFLDVEFEIA